MGTWDFLVEQWNELVKGVVGSEDDERHWYVRGVGIAQRLLTALLLIGLLFAGAHRVWLSSESRAVGYVGNGVVIPMTTNPLEQLVKTLWDTSVPFTIFVAFGAIGAALGLAALSLKARGFVSKWQLFGLFGLWQSAQNGWRAVREQGGFDGAAVPDGGVGDFLRNFLATFVGW